MVLLLHAVIFLASNQEHGEDGACVRTRARNPDARCDADGTWYWCECRYCTLQRNCTSDSSLSSCACPAGIVKGRALQQLWAEPPLSPRWWTRFGFLDIVLGLFCSVLMFLTWSMFFLHLVIVCEKGCSRASLMKPSPVGECPMGVVIPLSLALGLLVLYFASGSGPAGVGISILIPSCCMLRIYCQDKSRSNIRNSPPRHLRRELSNPRTLVRGVQPPPTDRSTAQEAPGPMQAAVPVTQVYATATLASASDADGSIPVVQGSLVDDRGGTSDGSWYQDSESQSDGLSDRLRELEQAKANGRISQAEFDEAKRRLLNAV